MRILAIDSSSMVATVAVVTDGVLTAEYTINHKKTHSQTLLPMIDEIKKNIDLDMNTVDAIAIAGVRGHTQVLELEVPRLKVSDWHLIFQL